MGFERGHDGHHRLHNAGTLWTVGRKAASAPAHAWMHETGNAPIGARVTVSPTPPGEHLLGLCPYLPPDATGATPALDHDCDVAPQIFRPQPPPAEIPDVGTAAIHHPIPPAGLAPEFLCYLGSARPLHDYHGGSSNGPASRAAQLMRTILRHDRPYWWDFGHLMVLGPAKPSPAQARSGPHLRERTRGTHGPRCDATWGIYRHVFLDPTT